MQKSDLWGLTWVPLSDVIKATVPPSAMAIMDAGAELTQADDPKREGYVYVGITPKSQPDKRFPPFMMYMRADGVGQVFIAVLKNGEYQEVEGRFKGAPEPEGKVN